MATLSGKTYSVVVAQALLCGLICAGDPSLPCDNIEGGY
jgi:hypothetical protein